MWGNLILGLAEGGELVSISATGFSASAILKAKPSNVFIVILKKT